MRQVGTLRGSMLASSSAATSYSSPSFLRYYYNSAQSFATPVYQLTINFGRERYLSSLSQRKSPFIVATLPSFSQRRGLKAVRSGYLIKIS